MIAGRPIFFNAFLAFFIEVTISDFGKKLAMHVASSDPLAIDEKNIEPEILNKEKKKIEKNKSTCVL